jgi:hypothetical protein
VLSVDCQENIYVLTGTLLCRQNRDLNTEVAAVCLFVYVEHPKGLLDIYKRPVYECEHNYILLILLREGRVS